MTDKEIQRLIDYTKEKIANPGPPEVIKNLSIGWAWHVLKAYFYLARMLIFPATQNFINFSEIIPAGNFNKLKPRSLPPKPK